MELETTNLTRDWWLVKVPNFMDQAFSRQDCGATLGKLKVTRTARGQQVTLDVDPKMSVDGRVLGEEDCPRANKLSLQPAPKYAMAVLSETLPSQEANPNKDGTILKPEHVSVEGRILQKAEMRPASTVAYMAQKRKQVAQVQATKKPIIKIDNFPTLKPVSSHKEERDFQRQTKEIGKRVRKSKEEVEEMLFAHFERHQYYSFNDLVKLTDQPQNHLKDILKGIAIYNVKNPHKHMWELKPELRRYEEDGKTPAAGTS